MSKHVIDVAVWNQVLNYQRIKAALVEGAIVKVINRSGTSDGRLETHLFGFSEAGIPIVGGYNYSYATTVRQGVEDANRVITIAKGRIPKIYLDVEDEVQKGLGKGLIDIILAYQQEIQSAGLQFGVYTGQDFYNTYLKPYAPFLPVDFWIARYPSVKELRIGELPEQKKQPKVHSRLVGWQYSDKGVIDGIQGHTDLNVWYDELEKINQPMQAFNPYQEPKRILKVTFPLQRGNDVKWLQYYLIRKGFLGAVNKKKSAIDGVFGKQTETALKMAQLSFGILADGKCGGVTKAFLKA